MIEWRDSPAPGVKKQATVDEILLSIEGPEMYPSVQGNLWTDTIAEEQTVSVHLHTLISYGKHGYDHKDADSAAEAVIKAIKIAKEKLR